MQKNNIKTHITFTLFIALVSSSNLIAQISDADGINPLDGVKTQFDKKNNVQNSSNELLIRTGFVSVEELMKLTGQKNDKENIEKLNQKLISFAQKYKLKLIIQEAVYINPKLNITNYFYTYYKGDSMSENFLNNLPAASPNFVRYINTAKIFKEAELAKKSSKLLEAEFKNREAQLQSYSDKYSSKFLDEKKYFDEDLSKRKNEELQKLLTIANEKVKIFAQQKNIDVILQEAVYISPELDITNEIISQLK
jgi:outer membrane protein